MAKDKAAGDKPGRSKTPKVLGPATIARPALIGAAVLALARAVNKI
jgi:hypothetical protein